VDNGIVTLKGAVSSRWQKRMAEDTVETVSGVRDVRNQLEIREEGGEQT
jgi:osmotically-inducible protein OsmY